MISTRLLPYVRAGIQAGPRQKRILTARAGQQWHRVPLSGSSGPILARGFAKKYQPVEPSDQSITQLQTAGWDLSQGKLTKEYKFGGFRNAWAFLTEVAMHSHLKGHHPRISNLYNQVEIALYTDDIGSLSVHDIKMAEKCDEFAKKYA